MKNSSPCGKPIHEILLCPYNKPPSHRSQQEWIIGPGDPKCQTRSWKTMPEYLLLYPSLGQMLGVRKDQKELPFIEVLEVAGSAGHFSPSPHLCSLVIILHWSYFPWVKTLISWVKTLRLKEIKWVFPGNGRVRLLFQICQTLCPKLLPKTFLKGCLFKDTHVKICTLQL